MRISEQAKEASRSRILEKAAELFIDKGFDATTTRDIALASGLAAGTIFNYFPSKETLAMTMVNEALATGSADFQRRRCGDEDLAEELFLFIVAGLRQLRPLRPFLGPVLERSLSPFPRKNICREGEAARLTHLAGVEEIMGRHGFSDVPDDVAMTIYWSLYLGILAFWSNDASPDQEASQGMIDYALRFFVQAISGSGVECGGAHAGE